MIRDLYDDEYTGDILKPLDSLESLDCKSHLQKGKQRIYNRKVAYAKQDIHTAVDGSRSYPALETEPHDGRKTSQDAGNLNARRTKAAS